MHSIFWNLKIINFQVFAISDILNQLPRFTID